ncbi:MAG: hypothetical protein COA79_15925 [Planctomycetota bacterium]|nr:MAG: hypothetical protein COA79_15925 [Planctomycetota bacterium]
MYYKRHAYNMNIEEIVTENITEFAELFANTFSLPPWSEGWSIDSSSERLGCFRNTPNFIGLAAYEEKKLLGFIFGNYEPYLDYKLFNLKEMCVKLEYQRKSVGTKLLTKLHEILLLQNISRVNLLTRSDSMAENFYLKNGYYKSKVMGLYIFKL